MSLHYIFSVQLWLYFLQRGFAYLCLLYSHISVRVLWRWANGISSELDTVPWRWHGFGTELFQAWFLRLLLFDLVRQVMSMLLLLLLVVVFGSDAKDFLFWRVVWARAIPIGARVVGSACLLLVHATARTSRQFGWIGSLDPWLTFCGFKLVCRLTYRLVLLIFITVTSWVEI